MEDRYKQREEYETLKIELAMAEEEEKMRYQEKSLLEKRIKEREDYKKQYQLMMQERQERIARRQREEEEYRLMLLKEMEEADRVEQMNAQKARLKREEHKREVNRLLDE